MAWQTFLQNKHRNVTIEHRVAYSARKKLKNHLFLITRNCDKRGCQSYGVKQIKYIFANKKNYSGTRFGVFFIVSSSSSYLFFKANIEKCLFKGVGKPEAEHPDATNLTRDNSPREFSRQGHPDAKSSNLRTSLFFFLFLLFLFFFTAIL